MLYFVVLQIFTPCLKLLFLLILLEHLEIALKLYLIPLYILFNFLFSKVLSIILNFNIFLLKSGEHSLCAFFIDLLSGLHFGKVVS